MQIFVLENNIAKPNPETLLIPAFKAIWDEDTSTGKENAIRAFTFIELMCSPKQSNPFAGYTESERPEKIITQVLQLKVEEFPRTELIVNAMETYLSFLTEASFYYGYLMDAKFAAEKTRKFFRTFSYEDVNLKSGMPLYKPKEITSAINDSSQVIQNLLDLEEKVQQEMFDATKTKGMRQIGHYED